MAKSDERYVPPPAVEIPPPEVTLREDFIDPPDRQEATAITLFKWWWHNNREVLFQPYETPLWSDANEEAQAFWMDGAWTILKALGDG